MNSSAHADAVDDAETRTAIKCRRCDGWIHSPASVAAGIGSTCAKRERASVRLAAQPGLFDLDQAAASPVPA